MIYEYILLGPNRLYQIVYVFFFYDAPVKGQKKPYSHRPERQTNFDINCCIDIFFVLGLGLGLGWAYDIKLKAMISKLVSIVYLYEMR